MTWLFLIVAALAIAWLASSAVRKQKYEGLVRHPKLKEVETSTANEVGHT